MNKVSKEERCLLRGIPIAICDHCTIERLQRDLDEANRLLQTYRSERAAEVEPAKQPSSEQAADDIVHNLELSCVASCQCVTKTPDAQFHDRNCRYRAMQEAIAFIELHSQLTAELPLSQAPSAGQIAARARMEGYNTGWAAHAKATESMLVSLPMDEVSLTKLLIETARDSGFQDPQWRALFYQQGPYDVTVPCFTLKKFCRLLLEKLQPTLAGLSER